MRDPSSSTTTTLSVLVLGGGPVGLLLCNMLLRTIKGINVDLVDKNTNNTQKQILFINEDLIGVNNHDDSIKQLFSDIMHIIKTNACAFEEGLPPVQEGFCCKHKGEGKTKYFDTHHQITHHLREELQQFQDDNHVDRTELLKNISSIDNDTFRAKLESLPHKQGNFRIIDGDTNNVGNDYDLSQYNLVIGCDGSNNALGKFLGVTRYKPLNNESLMYGYIVTASTSKDIFNQTMNNCKRFAAPQHNVRFFTAVHGDAVNLYVGCMFQIEQNDDIK